MVDRPRVRVVVAERPVALDLPFPVEVTSPPATRGEDVGLLDWDEPDNPITSYFTVPDVSSLRELGADELGRWVDELPAGHPVAIEVHRGDVLRGHDLDAVIEVAEHFERAVVIRFDPDA
jgi:hypothetical protein